MAIDPARLLALARQGNGDYAVRELPGTLSGDHLAGAWQQAMTARVADGSILAPLVVRTRPSEALLSTVRVELGPGDMPWASGLSRASVEAALVHAWRDVAGPGAPPAAHVVLDLAGILDVEVDGSSLYLASYLAAVAVFGDEHPTRTVVATGSFDDDIAGLAAKVNAARWALRTVPSQRLLVATRSSPLAGEGVELVGSLAEARRKAFDIDPWHVGATRHRVRVTIPRLRDKFPPGFDPSSTVVIEMPDEVLPDHVGDIVARTRRAVGQGDRVALAYGGPLPVAAALGYALRNDTAAVRIVGPQSGEVFWHNRAQPPAGKHRRDHARVVVAPADVGLPAGWDLFPVPVLVTAGDVPGLVRRFAERYRAVRDLHLAFKTTGALAWAFGGIHKNHGRVTFYEWQPGVGGYQPFVGSDDLDRGHTTARHRGKALFSPLGLSPGSLFSAIVRERPDRVFVVTSAEGAKALPEIERRARELHPTFELAHRVVGDAFAGFVEGRAIARELAAEAGEENVVNLVGGTTALQDAVQVIARRLAAREIAVIDRRALEEQRRDPYVLGEKVDVPAGE